MRSFIVSILATLAFALFTYAAPMPAEAAPVYAIAARADDKPTIEKTFNKCYDGVKPHADALAALDVDVKIEVIVDLFAKITVVLKACIEDIKVLAKLKFEDIICDSNGVALSVTVIAGFCIKLILLLVNVCISVLAICSVEIKAQVTVIITDLLCLLGELLSALLDICVSIRLDLIVCIVAQITVCIKFLLDLKIDIMIKLLGLHY